MTEITKTSLLVPSQLPEFIRDDPSYNNFVSFLQAYYQWMELPENAVYETKNLLSYRDVDETTTEFLNYFINDFLPYFPEDALTDKTTAIKVARELYHSKGTPASYQLLFRMLYDSDFDYFYTNDAVLAPSSGIWYVSKSLSLKTDDPYFLNLAGYRAIGETSKSVATIENSINEGVKTEVFISNIEQLFESGETIRIVDSKNRNYEPGGYPLRAKLLGQISSININPTYRGLLYQPGDPVVIYGGLESSTGIGASATIKETTTGAIQRINVVSGGFGYTPDPTNIVSTSNFYGVTTMDLVNAPGAIAVVGELSPENSANVTFIPINTIDLKQHTRISANNYYFSNVAISNANTTLANAFTFASFETYPISQVYVENGGGGIKVIPTVSANSKYTTDVYDPSDPTNSVGNNIYGELANLGILAPIQITSVGAGYANNDIILIQGGTGYGATAKVTEVSDLGEIISVQYTQNKTYPLGGMGYRLTGLPVANVVSANTQASGAELYIPGILGTGAEFSLIVDRVGSITSFDITNYGEDYIAAPSISLKIEDILVTGIDPYNKPQKGDVIYQGESVTHFIYKATVDSIQLLQSNINPTLSIYSLRVFGYTSIPSTGFSLIDSNLNINMSLVGQAYPANYFYVGSPEYNNLGVKVYGDGTAQATAKFLNGLTISQGQYLNSTGQLSSYDVIQSENYNKFTYQITVNKEIARYRDILLNLVHPTGTKLIGRYALNSANNYNSTTQQAQYVGKTLYAYTQTAAAYVTMTSDFHTPSNNIINFYNTSGVNLSGFIFANSSTIAITPTNGPNIYSEVIRVDDANNEVQIASNVFLTYANVALVSIVDGSNQMNVLSLTGEYNIINDGLYSNTAYPLMDIVFAGDTVTGGNTNVMTVDHIDYTTGNGVIYTTNIISGGDSHGSFFSQSIIDTFSASEGVEFIYNIELKANNNFQVIELNLVQNTQNVEITQFGEVLSGSLLGTFDANIDATGNVNLLLTPNYISTDIKISRTNPYENQPFAIYSSPTTITVDTFPTSTNSVTYDLLMYTNTDVHSLKLKILQNGSSVYISQYAEVQTGPLLGTFDVEILYGTVLLNFTPINSTVTLQLLKNDYFLNASSLQFSTAYSSQTIDTFQSTYVHTLNYQLLIQTNTGQYQVSEVKIAQNESVSDLSQYAVITTDGVLGEFDLSISSYECNLIFTPYQANTTVTYLRQDLYTSPAFNLYSPLYLTVHRNMYAGGSIENANQIKIFGPLGTQYYPEITTENGIPLTTESGNILLLG